MTHSQLVVSVRLRLLTILNACCFLPNGQQNSRAKQEDGGSASDAVRPREIPLCYVELDTIAVNFRDEHHRKDNDSRQQGHHCNNTQKQLCSLLTCDAQWYYSLMNHFHINQEHSTSCCKKWGFATEEKYQCGKQQMMLHITSSCTLRKLESGLQWLHSVDDVVLSMAEHMWLKDTQR